ncbi:MAG: hypothetical protein JW837_18210 [Sedimentisphaerales bacterium]|nr:hypothetical protein [Sedimentisphaerales bacterium]
MTATKCEEHSGLVKAIENLEDSDRDQWEAIKKIQNRLPVWATAVISLLTFLLGCSLRLWK